MSLLFVLTSCETIYPTQDSMNCHIDEVTYSSVTVSFTADIPLNATDHVVGVKVAAGDPMSEDGFEEMLEAKPGRNDYKITINALSFDTEYNIRAFVRAGIDGHVTWGEINSFTTMAYPEMVDLGLSVKWRGWNLGASKPEDYGGYYQWAGTEDVTSTSFNLTWGNCPYHTGSLYSVGWTKYNTESSFGIFDNKIILDPEDDVAHVILGGEWRMPTIEDWQELIDNCSWTWTTLNEREGYLVQSQKPGFTNNWIFLPTSGYRYGDSSYFVGSGGFYWSSLLYTDRPNHSCYLYFASDEVNTKDISRCDGLSVRPVSEK